MFDLLHDEDWSLDCRCCLHFCIFSNPHVSNMVLMLVMMIVRNKINCILNHTAPVPWPSPLTRVVSLDSLSPVLSLTDMCGCWLPPQLVTSLEPPLGPGWYPRSHIWSSLTQRRRSIVWTWSLWKMELVLLTRDLLLHSHSVIILGQVHRYSRFQVLFVCGGAFVFVYS